MKKQKMSLYRKTLRMVTLFIILAIVVGISIFYFIENYPKIEIKRIETEKIVKEIQIEYVEVPYFFDNEGNIWKYYTITGYSSNDSEQGTTNMLATGFCLDDYNVSELHIVASNCIPKYSFIEIEGMGAFIVLDTGLGYKVEDGWEDKDWIDIYFKNKLDAKKWGIQQRKVRIINDRK